MAFVKKWRCNVDELHAGDNVFLGDRKMIVLAVNRDGRRVLVSGRKHSCANCDIRWIDEKRLGTRPRKLANRVIKHVNAIPVDTMDGISNWVPTKIPSPTAAPPGSRDKIEILRLRIVAGEQLWHAQDVGWEGWNGFGEFGRRVFELRSSEDISQTVADGSSLNQFTSTREKS